MAKSGRDQVALRRVKYIRDKMATKKMFHKLPEGSITRPKGLSLELDGARIASSSDQRTALVRLAGARGVTWHHRQIVRVPCAPLGEGGAGPS